MIVLPHDTSDLMLAPMLLDLEANIERLSTMPLPDLVLEVALLSNIPDWSRANREEGLTRTVCSPVDCRDWEFSWVPRGLCVAHRDRRVVLGVPTQFADYIDGVHRATRTA